MGKILKRAGILMPISALPSNEGIGTLGRSAYAFADLLHEAGHTVWQVLPLTPTGYGDSPYQSCCSNALNYYFIDLENLVSKGLLTPADVMSAHLFDDKYRVNFQLQFKNKISLLKRAFSAFKGSEEFSAFVMEGEYSDFALFMAAKEFFGYRPWYEWEEPMRSCEKDAVARFSKQHAQEISFWQWTQFETLRQWKALKAYANGKNISVMGDLPLYVAYDSVEVWKYGGELFKMDEKRRPDCVAGVPPDAFSDDGQLWGNPVYDWQKMKKDGYKWWNKRIRDAFRLFDVVRVDHFRGFDRYYEIPFGDENAKRGQWADGPKEDFFKDKRNLKIVAEDLGVIDDGVRKLMKFVGYPGMKVLSFAFDGNPENEYKPRFYPRKCVCYTGTHDNMPLKQFFDGLDGKELERVKEEITGECEALGIGFDVSSPRAMALTTVGLAYACNAELTIVPYWDVLAKGIEARFNFPSTVSPQNWSMRFLREEFSSEVAARMRSLAQSGGRA